MKNVTRSRIQKLLDGTGVTLDGDDPWDLQIHDRRFYRRVLAQGSLGLGEAYMDGWWDCDRIDEFIARVIRHDPRERLGWNLPIIWEAIKARSMNRQSVSRAFRIGEAHYDKGNNLYRAMLDDRMVYTCGYWKNVDNLNDA